MKFYVTTPDTQFELFYSYYKPSTHVKVTHGPNPNPNPITIYLGLLFAVTLAAFVEPGNVTTESSFDLNNLIIRDCKPRDWDMSYQFLKFGLGFTLEWLKFNFFF